MEYSSDIILHNLKNLIMTGFDYYNLDYFGL